MAHFSKVFLVLLLLFSSSVTLAVDSDIAMLEAKIKAKEAELLALKKRLEVIKKDNLDETACSCVYNQAGCKAPSK